MALPLPPLSSAGMSTPADCSPSREEGRTSTLVSGTVIEGLTDDLVVEILSRVPVKSICRFRCVISKYWLSLIGHPDHRKKLPQTLAGFFNTCTNWGYPPEPALGFINVLGRHCPPIDISFSFLPDGRVEFLDCCNGLLLCRWYHTLGDDGCCYVVCNPATEEWVALPDPSHACGVAKACLGFDPTMSSNFYVFVLLEVNLFLIGVDVYSSETRRWAHKKKGWNDDITITFFDLPSCTVFFNGFLHFHAFGTSRSSHCLASVDTKGETWTIFRHPGDLRRGFLQLSQGCLHYSNFQRNRNGAVVGLVVYVLKDYENKEWILKHSVENSHLSGLEGHHPGYRGWMMIHPQCDSIFFTEGWATRFVCYNMDCQQIKVISNLEYGDPPYLPYVPFYAKLESLHR